MRKLLLTCPARLPLQFRVLYRQFLLRVVDLEALSIEADIPRFLGQFAGILIFISLVQAIGALWTPPPPGFAWHMEQSAVSHMMLVVGLIVVLTWDSTFPDRRDAMVLGPLPIKPRTILLARIGASSALLALTIVCLNFASSVAWSLVFAAARGTGVFLRFLASYWLTMIAASAFLYGTVLTVQGLTAFLLPRRLFLRLSAILQLAAFGLFLSVYFLAPFIESKSDLIAIQNQPILAASPVPWFFALFNECNGSLPANATWLAHRAWIGLVCAAIGAAGSLLICYLRTMRKTVEEPDLIPAGRGLRWTLQLGGSLHSAVLLFIVRALNRSRQHRVILAFFYAIVCACALGLLHHAPKFGSTMPVSPDFVVLTIWMMVFAVLGFRAIFPLPISLTANWVLRITQLRSPQAYIGAVRRSLILLAVVPVLMAATLFSLSYRPFSQTGAHLAVLTLLGFILTEISLIGFYKIPFTCSYLPGKSNIQFVFWGCFVGIMLVMLFILNIEIPALQSTLESGLLLLLFTAAAAALYTLNCRRAHSAILYFEEPPPEVLTTLGLLSALPPTSIAKKP
jgi:hypothetical protein